MTIRFATKCRNKSPIGFKRRFTSARCPWRLCRDGNKRITVKIVDDQGVETLRVMEVA